MGALQEARSEAVGNASLLHDFIGHVIAVHTARAAPALCEAARLLISQARGSASRGRELQSQQLLAGRHGF